MKIGVLSDTHIPVSARKLPQKVYDYFKKCDLIVHAGDSLSRSVIKDLESIAETKAVRGNMDDPDLEYLPEKIVFTAGGKKIGVVHGKGPSFAVMQVVKGCFAKMPDVIIFGHSHTPYNKEEEGTLFFNPGSPTDTIFAPYRSFGIIDINNGNIHAEIIKVDE